MSTKRLSAADMRALRVRKKYLVEIIKAMGWEPEEDVLKEALEMDIVREVNEVTESGRRLTEAAGEKTDQLAIVGHQRNS